MKKENMPKKYTGNYRKILFHIPLTDCLNLVSSVIENPHYDYKKETMAIYQAMVIKLLLRYLLNNNGHISTSDDLINPLSKLYRINTTMYYNNMYIDCFYQVVGMFNSLIRLYKIEDILKVEVHGGSVGLFVLTRE